MDPQPDAIPPPDQPSPPPTIDDLVIPPPPSETPPPPPEKDVSPPPCSSDQDNAPHVKEAPQTGNGNTPEDAPPSSVISEKRTAQAEDDAVLHEYDAVIGMASLDAESPSPTRSDPDQHMEEGSSIHNASTLPSTRPMATAAGGYEDVKQNGHYEMTPEDQKAAMKTIKRHRQEAVMWVIIFVLAAGVIAVIFYFAYSIVVAQEVPVPDGPFHIRVVVQLEKNWTEVEDLEISSSQSYMNYSTFVKTGVDTTFKSNSSEFVDVYLRAEIFSFSQSNAGNIRLSFVAFFSAAPVGISLQGAFTERFTAELRGGFEAGNIEDLRLKQGEPIIVVSYTSSTMTTTTAA